jgi:ubiquinone/menaquinone biosynthesis C-methylase UbiE
MVMEKLFVNAKKPKGRMGRMMASGMNGGAHERLARWGMTHFEVRGDVLDIGCGGGGNISRMLPMDGVSSVKGLDYSEVSVAKSREVNAAAIADGRCEIIQGDVRDMPFLDCSLDIVTAFETVYFWPEIGETFKQVYRVVRPGGLFAVTNESDGEDKSAAKYQRMIDGMNLYTPERLKELMEAAGFTGIEMFRHEERPWITVVGRRG